MNGRVKSARRAHAVYAQKIVVTVGRRPLPVINQPRWDGFELFIDQRVRSHDHRIRAFAQGVDDFLQSLRRAVKVIGIKLHRITPAERRRNRFIPAPADTQVAPSRDDMAYIGIFRGKLF